MLGLSFESRFFLADGPVLVQSLRQSRPFARFLYLCLLISGRFTLYCVDCLGLGARGETPRAWRGRGRGKSSLAN